MQAGLMQAGLHGESTLPVWPWKHPAEPWCRAGYPSAGEPAAKVTAAGCCCYSPSCIGYLACHLVHRRSLCSKRYFTAMRASLKWIRAQLASTCMTQRSLVDCQH